MRLLRLIFGHACEFGWPRRKRVGPERYVQRCIICGREKAYRGMLRNLEDL